MAARDGAFPTPNTTSAAFIQDPATAAGARATNLNCGE
jgi:hypothetical protein